MKKISFILLAVALLAVLMSGTALANFGPHGGYQQDTDACAACHRAHTAFSSLTWNTVGSPTSAKSALLVSNASTMTQFCYSCHGDGAPGASTNVQGGRFDSGPSGATGEAKNTSPHSVNLLYTTSSSFDATLNGGGFEKMGAEGASSTVSSTHQLDLAGSTSPMWGNGSALPLAQNLTCTDCHDPHGSSNYRLLRDTLNFPGGSAVVGGYDASNTPTPFVISAETGYPSTGWLKGADGAAQVASYSPNYTSYLYKVNAGDTNASFSRWCAGCHTQYNNKQSAYNYGSRIGGGAAAANTTYHRHPVDTSLVSGKPGPNPPSGTLAFPTAMLIDPGLPLEAASGSSAYNDYLTCLTCHYAHGTVATMSGWAAGGIVAQSVNGTVQPVPFQGGSAYDGVQPTSLSVATAYSPTPQNGTSALLRYNGRGVCERCHNK